MFNTTAFLWRVAAERGGNTYNQLKADMADQDPGSEPDKLF